METLLLILSLILPTLLIILQYILCKKYNDSKYAKIKDLN